MSAALRKDWLDEADYLDSEPLAEAKREYVAGEVYAMAGTTARGITGYRSTWPHGSMPPRARPRAKYSWPT